MGLSNYQLDDAIAEVLSLLKGQWANGMIPHIVFHSENEKSYFPNYDYWNSQVNRGAPKKIKTSGISQPPVLGFVLEEIANKHKDSEKFWLFLREIFPKVCKYHEWWYNQRDLHKEGLIFIFHPWESGRDNSPIWDNALNKINIDKDVIGQYQRRDTAVTDQSERPTQKQYDEYVHLLQLGKRHKYEGEGISSESEFLIQDSMMNAILIHSNKALIRLGKEIGYDTAKIREWQSQSEKSFETKLWNDQIGVYTGYDLVNKEKLNYFEIGGIASLIAGTVSKDNLNQLVNRLESWKKKSYYLCPSFDPENELFDSRRYWRGPVWPQMNWLVYKALLNYGHLNLAKVIKIDLVELVKNFGFYEYFDPRKSEKENLNLGCGGNHFSWTASTIIDFLSE